jgi:PHD/YefM family antitoxin component YafN of YafNO toxin-antitoxin module
MNVMIWFRNLSRRVIRLFSYTSNNLFYYSKVELGSGVNVMSENQKPVWIKRDGVDVAVVISPELFEELVSAQEELEDIAAVDEAMKDKSPGIPWEQVQKELAKDEYVFGPDIDLDIEVVLDHQGNRITEARAQEMALETLREFRASRADEIGKQEKLELIIDVLGLLEILEVETLEKYFGVSESTIDEWLEEDIKLSHNQTKLMLDLKYLTDMLEFHIYPDQIKEWIVGSNSHLNSSSPIDVLALKGMGAVLPAVEALFELNFDMESTPVIKKRLARKDKAVSVDIDEL